MIYLGRFYTGSDTSHTDANGFVTVNNDFCMYQPRHKPNGGDWPVDVWIVEEAGSLPVNWYSPNALTAVYHSVYAQRNWLIGGWVPVVARRAE